jgi:hypothetical protein
MKRLAYDSVDTSTDALPTDEEVVQGGFYTVMEHYFKVEAALETVFKAALEAARVSRARAARGGGGEVRNARAGGAGAGDR